MEIEIHKIFKNIKIFILHLYRKRFIRFGFVGGLGTLTNLLIFFIFVDVLKFTDIIIQVIGFLAAVTQNFILNSLFTFKNDLKMKLSVYIRYIKFVLTSVLGLAINLVVYNIIIYLFNPEIKVICQAIGILSGMVINFLGSKFFVFGKKRNVEGTGQ
jgi:putative flippase GtrA